LTTNRISKDRRVKGTRHLAVRVPRGLKTKGNKTENTIEIMIVEIMPIVMKIHVYNTNTIRAGDVVPAHNHPLLILTHLILLKTVIRAEGVEIGRPAETGTTEKSLLTSAVGAELLIKMTFPSQQLRERRSRRCSD
jgi:hypothetical protein